MFVYLLYLIIVQELEHSRTVWTSKLLMTRRLPPYDTCRSVWSRSCYWNSKYVHWDPYCYYRVNPFNPEL